ncbi:MAG: ABC transporter ATP-binding protein [Desulfovibrio sp.]|nr:MAG: ABC transporter ATP-binding protein [Desulfovibrio sp.]
MTESALLFHDVCFSYQGMTRDLICGLSAHFSRGWTGVAGANGAGKSTILKLAAGLLAPGQGRVSIPGETIYCPQRTDDVPERFARLLADTRGPAARLKGRLGIHQDWESRWENLSHGERKRAQIAVALWLEPGVLALDEPTNHLDAEARDMLFGALSAYAGVGLLVSHDRRFMDGLCRQCLFVDPPEVVLRPGNYSQGREQAAMDQATLRKLGDQARQEYQRLKREAAKRRSAASRADKRRSKKGVARKDHDAKAKIDAARLTGKDGVDGKLLNQLKGRLSQAQDRMDGIRVNKEYATGIWMQGQVSQRSTLFHIPEGRLDLGGGRRLEFPDLSMRPDSRVALSGVNGCGKSTLIARIMDSLGLEPERVTYVPQEIDLAASQGILERALGLPGPELGQLMIVVSRLGSRPQRLLESVEPSPGEIRKLLLALGIARTPHLIVMDEPTNHLDLPSIECLEAALAECPCGLLLVSHDENFVRALARERWHIAEPVRGQGKFVLEKRLSV